MGPDESLPILQEPIVSDVSRIYTVHSILFYFLNIHFNIILKFTHVFQLVASIKAVF